MRRSSVMFYSTILGCILMLNCMPVNEVKAAQSTYTPAMADYCVTPPFLSGYVPPQVLFTLGKDHKFFYPAYNDVTDIDGDGQLDVGYKHSIVYKGYFDPNKCYDYTTITGKEVFAPTGAATNRYCDGSKWSGNFLNWVTMSRADIVKKVLYGGNRTRDTSSGIGETYLSGEGIPQDGHAWGKEYAGADIQRLVPEAKSVVNNHRALFCVVHNGSDNDQFKLTSNATPIAQFRMLPDMQAAVFSSYAARNGNTGLRIWDWVNVEMGSATSKNICSDAGIDTDGNGSIDTVTNFPVQKYEVTAKVCDVLVGIEDNCKTYGNNTKPQGLMQQYGEPLTSQQVCSKDMSTPCSSNSDCSSNGECVDNTGMFFGLMAGSYQNPKAGGYLRKNLWGITNETVASTGLLQTSDPDQKGLIMKSIEGLKCPAGTGYYPLSKHWGNPIGEIMYEAMRYYGGKAAPTPEYIDSITSTSDAGLYASKPDWDNPSLLFPSCSIPFVLLFSDVYNSFDDDEIPGSHFPMVSTTATNLNHFDAKALANAISTNESKTSAIIGVSGTSASNGMCTAKSINGFGEIEGICPAEGDLQGTYYPAAAAYYGRTKMKTEENKSDVLTYVVAFNSNIPEFVLNAGGNPVTVIPMAKALADGSGVSDWSCTTSNFDFDIDATRGLQISPKTGMSGKCPTMAIVSVYVEEHRYDASNKLNYVRFKVASDTLNATIDYDMDGVAEYTVCAGPVGCSDLSVPANQVKVTVTALSSSAGTNFAHGYVISGTSDGTATPTDGAYLPVRKYRTNDKTPPTACGSLMWGDADLCTLPITKTQTFTSTSNNAALLKNPLWYAAKYGGFKDMDHNNLPYTDSTCSLPLTDPSRNPKCNEWSSKVPGVPDTYFEVSNPSQLEQRLRDALDAILARVSSGTAASILNNSEGSGASLLQAVFYPKKDFNNNTEANWIGEIHNMWYYIDPFLKLTSIREDTDSDYKLNLKNDKIAQFTFDASQNKTVVNLFNDLNGDGSPDSSTPDESVEPDDVMSLWKAGKKLWERNVTSDPNKRTIYTRIGIDGGHFDDLTSRLTSLPMDKYSSMTAAEKTTLNSYLQAASETEATNIIKYVHGLDAKEIDSATPPNYRNRTVTITGCGLTDTAGCTRTWKLSDIVTSTPKLVSNVNLNQYALSTPLGYADDSYSKFTATSTYKNRGMVFVGGNDGMLHAFKLGVLKAVNGKFDKGQFNNSFGTLATASDDLGREEWSFIPRQTLPYLTYLKDPNYCHVFYVDKTPTITDVTIERAGCTATNYWDCTKPTDGSSWRTILIGGTGLGGAAKWNGNSTYTAPTNSVKTPYKGATADVGLGYSSYFALDVTDPTTPSFKWEFPGELSTSAFQTLGYSTTGPAIVRISAKVKDAGLNDTTTPDHSKNGRWFAVFASGPTGPIDTVKREFKGQSDQQLRIFIVDMVTGDLVRTIENFENNVAKPLPTEAFAGSLSTSWIDSDRATPGNLGWYSDDAIYIGYTRKCTMTDIGCTSGTWTKGGVIRLLTNESINPDNWVASPLISDIGPVTTSVTKLQDRKNKNLWIYFGTGRYFFKNDTTTNRQLIYGVKEPCYLSTNNLMDGTCTAEVSGTIADQSGTFLPVAQTLNPTVAGWSIELDDSNSAHSAERMITDPLASTAGAVFFTTFQPSNDVCKFGGDTYIWAVRYDTGGVPPARAMQGKALMQVSTGAFAEISLSEAFRTKSGSTREDGRKLNTPISGVPPTAQGLSLITNPQAVKKILHVREK